MSKLIHLLTRLRKCGQVDRYIIRHYHKGPVAMREYAKRKYPSLFFVEEAGPFSTEQWGALKTKVREGLKVSYSMSKQMAQPLPATIDIEAWVRELDTMALCSIFGIPAEVYMPEKTVALRTEQRAMQVLKTSSCTGQRDNYMSWSIHFIGKRENIIKALNEHSEKLTGESKKEFDSYLSDLTNLVSANYNNNYEPTLKIVANGHRSEGLSTLNVNIGYVEGQVV